MQHKNILIYWFTNLLKFLKIRFKKEAFEHIQCNFIFEKNALLTVNKLLT